MEDSEQKKTWNRIWDLKSKTQKHPNQIRLIVTIGVKDGFACSSAPDNSRCEICIYFSSKDAACRLKQSQIFIKSWESYWSPRVPESTSRIRRRTNNKTCRELTKIEKALKVVQNRTETKKQTNKQARQQQRQRFNIQSAQMLRGSETFSFLKKKNIFMSST